MLHHHTGVWNLIIVHIYFLKFVFQAEIKRLQEANKAARKERQLLLKQQEEIERMRNSTLRLKERLKCAGGEVPSVSSATFTTDRF